MPINVLQDTIDWFRKAVPTPTSKNIHTQLGVHFEEVAEMIDEITGKDQNTKLMLTRAINALEDLAGHLKANDDIIEIKEEDRINFLDSICDQLVTAGGAAYMLDMDPVGGLNAVNISNFSKFDHNGNPIFDANQKVVKGPYYMKVDLNRFV
jgi:predicted HAD superfamily Cof-like phosphohydrolase